MRSISYEQYFDRVFGCFQGKCIAGTIGAPYEGMKQVLDIQYSPALFKNMLPNDDLDLQVLWLEVLEKKGVFFTSDDLAEAFLNRCPYSPGEYAVFKKNYRRGIHPPVSGWFNNRYYIEGMGCPIRSEIWACIAPGNPALASGLAEKDGIIDHRGNSIFAEQFFAALEAEAFFEDDLETLVNVGLRHIPEDSKTACLIKDVVEWCAKSGDWKKTRSRIISKYGHPDCTNLYQNIGITVMSLLLGRTDFIQTVMMALNCGFDTDCTCATAGGVLGVIQGADRMKKEYGFKDQRYILGVDAGRKSGSTFDLAQDICRMGLHFTEKLGTGVLIEGYERSAVSPEDEIQPELVISVRYDGLPAVGIGEEKKVTLVFHNTRSNQINGILAVGIPEGWCSAAYQEGISIDGGSVAEVELVLSIPQNISLLHETNIIPVEMSSQGTKYTYSFGLVGASVWKVYDPYWENTVAIGNLKPGESYIDHIPGNGRDDTLDRIRNYHLNIFADIKREYADMGKLSLPGIRSTDNNTEEESQVVNIYEDKFSINDVIGLQGPCVVYMVREFISPEERDAAIQVGHTDAFELWINGCVVCKRDNVDWWTAENVHISSFHLKKGTNRIALKLVRRSEKADFSICFLRMEGGVCGVLTFSEHITDFSSVNPGL